MSESHIADRQREKHIEFCRESERKSYEDLDKLKLSIPAILFGVIAFLSGTRKVDGSLLGWAIGATCLCILVTAWSYYAAACDYHKEYVEVMQKDGVNIKSNLSKFEVLLARTVSLSNTLSLGLAAASLAFVFLLVVTLPPKKEQPNMISVDEITLSKLANAMKKDSESPKTQTKQTPTREEKGSKKPARPDGRTNDSGEKK